MSASQCLEHGQPGPALNHVVLGMRLEPETARKATHRLVEMLGLEILFLRSVSWLRSKFWRFSRRCACRNFCQRTIPLRGLDRGAGSFGHVFPCIALIVDFRGSGACGPGTGRAVVFSGQSDAEALFLLGGLRRGRGGDEVTRQW